MNETLEKNIMGIIAVVAVIGSTVAVYTEIRSNQAVTDTTILALKAELVTSRESQRALADQLRSQLNKLSSDISYLQGQIQGSLMADKDKKR